MTEDDDVFRAMEAAENPTPIHETPHYREAVAFRTTIKPEKDTEYDWVYEYAKSQFLDAMVLYRSLDEKADTIIKHLGGGTGLFTLGVLAKVDHNNVAMVAWTIPSFMAALISIYFAMLARRPTRASLPPSAEGAFKYATQYKKESVAKAFFVGQWHEATVGLEAAMEIKANRVRVANHWFFAAIYLLVFPIVAAIILAS